MTIERTGADVTTRNVGGGAVMDMSPQEVGAQLLAIQNVMKVAMKDGVHFGTIPGCGEKPALLKPGADKLNLMFRLAPSYDVAVTDMIDGHREYRVTCRMVHAPSGTFLGEGVGSASTTETKWAYRWESTGREVPKDYWDGGRDPALLGGVDFVPRKVRGNDGKQTWIIFHRVAHGNPSDYYNTVLKMAKKRAHVDAVLTVTAASDIFDQDIDDLVENGAVTGAETGTEPVRTPRAAGKAEERRPVAEPTTKKPGESGPPDLNASPQTAQEQAAWIVEAMLYVAEGDEALAVATLKEWSEFTGKEDKKKHAIESRSQLFKSNPRWIASTYAKAKQAVAEKIEMMNGGAGPGGGGKEPEEELPFTAKD